VIYNEFFLTKLIFFTTFLACFLLLLHVKRRGFWSCFTSYCCYQDCIYNWPVTGLIWILSALALWRMWWLDLDRLVMYALVLLCPVGLLIAGLGLCFFLLVGLFRPFPSSFPSSSSSSCSSRWTNLTSFSPDSCVLWCLWHY
jgi:hypothetical protein